MAKKEGLLRLHKALLARQHDLRVKLSDDLGALKAQDGRDSADEAFDAGNEEINCQLAELEASELTQVERALQKLKKGTFGTCEGCQKKIPVGRLNAVPCCTMCIECQREMETGAAWNGASQAGGWERVGDKSMSMEDSMETVNLSDYER